VERVWDLSGLFTAHTATCGKLDIMWENVKQFSLPGVWVRLSAVLPPLSSYLHLIPASHSAFPNKIFTHFISPAYVLHLSPIRNFSWNAQQPNISNGLQFAFVNPLDMQSPLYLRHLLFPRGNIIPSFIHSFRWNNQELWFSTLWSTSSCE
jgi:hypothetical protein